MAQSTELEIYIRKENPFRLFLSKGWMLSFWDSQASSCLVNAKYIAVMIRLYYRSWATEVSKLSHISMNTLVAIFEVLRQLMQIIWDQNLYRTHCFKRVSYFPWMLVMRLFCVIQDIWQVYDEHVHIGKYDHSLATHLTHIPKWRQTTKHDTFLSYPMKWKSTVWLYYVRRAYREKLLKFCIGIKQMLNVDWIFP